MKAMILAAGRGDRMRPLTDSTPKPLLKVGGKSLIAWHLEKLAAAGFSEVVINHAYLGLQIEEALGDGQQFGLNIAYSPEAQALETAGGIANALDLLGDAQFLVINGDVFTDFNLTKLLNRPMGGDWAHLVLVDNPIQHPQGDFGFDGLRASNAEEGDRYTFSGIGVYSPQLFAEISVGQPAKLAPLLRNAIAQKKVTAEHYQGFWVDVGTPQRLHELDLSLSKL